MEPQDNKGPDGSSIKPVSSLRSHFENMTKPTADTPQQPQPAQQLPHPPPLRNTSPAPLPSPKPDRLRDGRSSSREPPAVPKNKPKDLAPHSTLQLPQAADAAAAPRSPQRHSIGLFPTSPRPVRPPSLMVDPPQSPPKGRALNIATTDQPSYLNPDAVTGSASPVTTPRPFKIPSRPHTPAVDPRRSPRIGASRPPSPPPPRRSAELRRERESKTAPPPPPVNRSEKPAASPRNSWIAERGRSMEIRRPISERISPFSSPPSSGPSGDENETPPPPALPTRPRPNPAPLQKIPALPVGFDPPPVHHSIASRRRERDDEVNGFARGHITPQVTGDLAPALPARPRTIAAEQPQIRNETQVTMPPPPRPPRAGVATTAASTPSLETVPQKRVVSNPTTQQQHPPPPLRTHGRSMTVTDKGSFRAPPADFRQAATPTEPRGNGVNGGFPARPSESGPNVVTTYPDMSSINRRPPFLKQGVTEISLKYDSRLFDVCGDLVCATGHLTRVWSLLDGEQLMSLAHGEGIKATSVAFKPGANVDEEGQRLWIGNNVGDLLEADIATQSVVCLKQGVHGRHEVIKIYRHFNELWTLDDTGMLLVWGPDDSSAPNLASNADQSYRLPRNHGFSMVVGDELWHATGKEIRVFLPSVDGRGQFQVLMRPLGQDGAGDVTAGTYTTSERDKVFFGHSDGKITIYSRKDYSCLNVLSISTYKINTLAGVGVNIWAGFNTGRISVYDTSQTPWAILKDWQAHDNPVVKIIPDRSSFYKLDRRQVVSLGADSMIRPWDGMLQDDWLESEMKIRDAQYCEFGNLKVLVMTWNAGASTPNSLRYSDSDAAFIQNLLGASDPPDILVFGFQELVDLEDKTATAKRFLKPKKKEGSDQERMSHQYRDWRDFLIRSLDDYMPGELYHLLQTAHLVGLFTCVFVKADLRERITSLSNAEVKRGMGGLHGNKGAIAVRFKVDDSSLCFVNCHLAAGQSQATHRHNDIAAILEANILPVEREPTVRLDSFVGGGDGTLILDHELCILNGDLNYRIDTMSRDTVVAAVKGNNLGKLLERDQLLVARRRNPTFRLRAFEEMPITFAPTYKYDVGTDNYDSSEKKRSPAWCDRLLYRAGSGKGRIRQLDYRRHEVRVSDHRPVSGRFQLTVKRVVPKRRAAVWMECQQQFEDLKAKDAQEEKLYYLTHVIGYDTATSKTLIKERSGRRDHRSPSRPRE